MQENGTQLARAERDPYLNQKVMSASPVQLIAYMFDAILAACKSSNYDRAERGLLGLIEALNFKHEEIALPMFQVYQYCLDQVRKENYAEVEGLIGGFKAAWSEAMNLK